MTTPSSASSKRSGSSRTLVFIIVTLLVIGGAIFAAKGGFGKKAQLDAAAYYTVKRADLPVTILEGGALRAEKEAQIKSEFAGQVRIIWLIPEGTYVTNGQKLVELDSADLKERVNTQRISLQTSLFSYELAKGNLEIQKSQNESTITNQALTVEFAISDLEKYKEGDAPQAVKDALSNIGIQEEELQRTLEKATNTATLAKMGFQTKSQLQADTLAAERAVIQMEQAKLKLFILTNFDQPKQLRRLQANLDNAKAELVRVTQRLDATFRQNQADLDTKKRSLDLTKDLLDDQEKQLAASIITAPQPGLVVYGSSGTTAGAGGAQNLIEEGALVTQNRVVIRLPDTSKMLVDLRVHESHINQVKVGLPAFVTIDSIPDHQFKGTVSKVGVLPDPAAAYSNPNLKVYAVSVMIDEQLEDIKPGVSARAEIIVTNLVDRLIVPIQAVSTLKGQQVCYVDRGGESPQAVPVTIGQFNEQFIDVLQGLKEGDRVLLSPPSTTEKTTGTEAEPAPEKPAAPAPKAISSVEPAQK